MKFNLIEIISRNKRKCIGKCDCGIIKEFWYQDITSGKSKSCGCLRDKLAKERSFRHGYSPRNGKRSYWYNLYKNIEMRTSNPNAPGFCRYEGKNKFNSFEEFIAYAIPTLGERPSPKHSIDRKNTYGDYEPGNIRWATKKEQADNRKPWGKGSVWRGVLKRPARNGRAARFESQIQINGKQIYLGSGDELKCRELFLEAYYNHYKFFPPEYKPIPIPKG